MPSPVAAAVAGCAVFALAALFGWLNPNADTAASVVQAVPARLGAPGAAASADTDGSIDDLAPHLTRAEAANTGGDPVAAPPPRPPPPPAPDPAMMFRQQLAAVFDDGGAVTAVLNESSGDGPQIRRLKAGDVFLGKWRLRQLSMTEAVLDDGAHQRRIAINGAAGVQ